MPTAKSRVEKILSEIEGENLNLVATQQDAKTTRQVLETLLQRNQAQAATGLDAFYAQELKEQCAVAGAATHIPYYRPLGRSRIPVLGGLLMAVRRASRRFLEYIFAPILHDQTAYNVAVSRTLGPLCDFVDKAQAQHRADQEEFETLTQAGEMQLEMIAELKSRLQEQQDMQAQREDAWAQRVSVLEQELAALRCAQNDAVQKLYEEIEKKEFTAFRTARAQQQSENKAAQVAAAVCDVARTVGAVLGGAPEEAQAPQTQETGDTYSDIDYFQFENHFRGSRHAIKKNQAVYLPYFAHCSSVVDLGSGRGEFLELLREHNIPAVGVDYYKEFVDFCCQNGLNAVQGDAVAYLRSLEDASVGGIFAAQLVEHLTTEQVVAMCRLAFQKLEKGGVLILETPNPTSLSIYTNAFYMDPSHQKPVHPKTLTYFLQEAGFGDVRVEFTQQSKVGYRLPLLDVTGAANLSQFNEGIDLVSDVLFGSQDYAVIAHK